MKHTTKRTATMFFSSMMVTAVFMSMDNVSVAGEANSEKQFRVPAGQRQLFLDDYGVAKIENLRHTMHQPRKRGAVIRSPKPTQTIQTRTAPVWDPEEKLFKFWVLTIDDSFWQSKDGLHWTPGPKNNMRITMAVYDGNDPNPARRFKAPLLNKGSAVSPDGIHWTNLGLPKIPSSDEGNFSYNPQEGLFIHTVKRSGKNGRAVAIATSRDFKTWNDFGIVFHADTLDQQRAPRIIQARLHDPTLQQTFENDPQAYHVDVYNMGVFRYEGLYIGLPAMFHSTGPVPNYPNTDGFHLIQLACSRDLKNWQRLGDRQTFIGPSRKESGAYDLTQILPPSAPVVKDDELWFYYTGLKYRASFTFVGTYPNGKTVPKPGLNHDAGAVCLAVLRRDGFISLDAGDKQGSITTSPFIATAPTLFVNVNASGGSLRIEALDSGGKLLAQSVPLDGDHRRAEVKWKQGDFAALKGQKIALRFTLQSAQFYSYWFDERMK